MQFIRTLFSIPFLGGFVALFFALVPMALIGGPLLSLMDAGFLPNTVFAAYMVGLVVCVASVFWLRLLDSRGKMRVMLPFVGELFGIPMWPVFAAGAVYFIVRPVALLVPAWDRFFAGWSL